MLGQLPPPWHGQAVATRLLFDHKWSNHHVISIPMTYSAEMDHVGKFGFSKIWTLFKLIYRSLKVIFREGDVILFYPPASAKWVPILRDLIFLSIVRRFVSETVFIFHASGLGKFLSKSALRRGIGLIAYGRADHHLEVAVEDKFPPHSVFNAKSWEWCPCGIEVPEARNRLKATEEPINILFIGSLQEGKGVLEILRTASILKQKGNVSRFRFHIVGNWFSDEFKKEAQDLREELNVQDLVHFLGPRTGKEKWESYQNADLFFFPSHYSSEATPIVLMEALGMGLPILTTNWAGIPAMLKGCKSAAILPIQSPESYATWLWSSVDELSQNELYFDVSIRFYRKHFLPRVFTSRVEASWDIAAKCN